MVCSQFSSIGVTIFQIHQRIQNETENKINIIHVIDIYSTPAATVVKT
jgi:hypothetical protein